MLLGNYNQWNANSGHCIGGVTDPTYWMKGGSCQMFYYGDSRVAGQTEYAAFNTGYNPPYSFVLSPKAGGMSSHNNSAITFAPAAALAGGLPGSGSTTITFTPTGTGGLIVSGSGTSTITFTPTATLISVASGSGSSTISFSTSALIGALAGVSGTTTVTFSPTGTIKAVGYMSGLSTNETEFSADNLARAVWDALAADFNTAGTMGELLGNASSAGDPWSTSLPGAYADGTAGKIVGQKLLTLAKFLALK